MNLRWTSGGDGARYLYGSQEKITTVYKARFLGRLWFSENTGSFGGTEFEAASIKEAKIIAEAMALLGG